MSLILSCPQGSFGHRARRRAHIVGAVAAAWISLSSLAAPAPSFTPLLLDWLVRNEIPTDIPVAPTPHPGADKPANAPSYVELQNDAVTQGVPVTLMLRDDTAPLDGTTDPFALLTYISWSQKVDYVFTDFETATRFDNVLATIALVKNADEVHVASARHGSYAFYPGPYDPAFAYPTQAFREEESAFYLTSGLTVAMPDAYSYAFQADHTVPGIWGRNVAPNVRSALFWSPLERVSITRKALPEGHQLVPWVASFIPDADFQWVQPPPKEDGKAVIQHMRLRGADGYFLLQSLIPDVYSNEELRADFLQAWHDVDWLFDLKLPVTFHNLETSKTTGVQWSAATVGDAAAGATAAIVTNLGNEPASVLVPTHTGEGVIVSINPGEHKTVAIRLVGDLTADFAVDGADLGLLLAAWGPCIFCPADLDASGEVDGADLGLLLASWSG